MKTLGNIFSRKWTVAALLLASALATAQNPIGRWNISFNAADAELELHHLDNGARIAGKLSFEAEVGNSKQTWSVAPARDSVSNRLALVNESNEVQGYVVFHGSGDTLHVTVIHRAAQSYRGRLIYQARAVLGSQTFACRTRPISNTRVIQMATGPADSRLNDSLFDGAMDTALRLDGAATSIRTVAPADGKPAFEMELTALIHDSERASLTFELIDDYYRSQWVPYYHPIDRTRCPRAPTGWMSWNTYFDKAGEKENLDEARIAARQLKPFGLEIWHIESWQDNSDQLPVSDFHNLNLIPNPRQFPSGMKWLADQIRALGFRPGIWTVPFGTGNQKFYEAHKDWFLHDQSGRPMSNWSGRYLLDPSQAEVRHYMEETHRVMARDWGYEYFKIDGMSGRNSGYSAHFYERPEVRAAFKEPCEDPFRLCVEALRRGIGPDRIWLACQGHYSGPEAGCADAARLGADIVHPNQPPQWQGYYNQGSTTLNQVFVNNIALYTDPDTLMVGTAAPLNYARIAATVIALPGQLTFFADKLAELPAERMKLLQQTLPVCDVKPLNLYPIFQMLPVWDLKVRRPFGEWDVASLFNWDDQPGVVGFTFVELGLEADAEYLIYDCWNEKLLGGFTGEFPAITLEPRSNRLLTVHRKLDHPQFLATDRHITQGGVSLIDELWNLQSKTLSGQTQLVGGFPSRLVFSIPDGFTVDRVTSPDMVILESVINTDKTVTLILKSESSGSVKWEMRFGHN